MTPWRIAGPPRPGAAQRALGIAAALWLALLIGCSIAAVRHPLHSIFDVYRDGAAHWWAAAPLYGTGMRAFVYLPSSALLFTPFAWLPPPLDDLLWRACSVAVFVAGVIRLMPGRPVHQAVVLILLLPCAGVDVLRGQASVAMAGLVFLGAAAVTAPRWGRAAAWLCLAVAIKPLAIVPLLLFAAACPPLRRWLPLGLAAVLLLPFASAQPGYVMAQYRDMTRVMLHAGDLGVTRFNDVAMMLHRFGADLPASALLAIRAAAAVGALVLALRRPTPPRVLALSVAWLMLFNPRTELGSYLALGAVIGVLMFEPMPTVGRVLMAAGILALGTQAYGAAIFRATDVWLKPLVCLAFAAWLVARMVVSGPTRPPVAVAGFEPATKGL